MNILAIISGEYGSGMYANIKAYGPATWTLETWKAPCFFPLGD